MEKRIENGKVITTMSFAEVFIDKDVFEKMTQDQQDQASKEVIYLLSRLVSYQPERSKREDQIYVRNEDGTYPHLKPVVGCGALNSMET
jgi:hypothetical protein